MFVLPVNREAINYGSLNETWGAKPSKLLEAVIKEAFSNRHVGSPFVILSISVSTPITIDEQAWTRREFTRFYKVLFSCRTLPVVEGGRIVENMICIVMRMRRRRNVGRFKYGKKEDAS